MKLTFLDFQFDCQSQVLSKGGTIQSIPDKATQLLAMFLARPSKLLSKEDILDEIWPNKVVSEQVIFQNISLLRGLFGKDAIQTYSKKGYQWQIPVSQLNDTQPSREIVLSAAPAADSTSIRKIKNLHFLQMALLITFVAVVLWQFGKTLPQKKVVPSTKVSVVSYDEGGLIHSTTETPTQSLFDSPEWAWQHLKISDDTILMGSKSYILEQGVALRFHFQSQNQSWQDYIWASSLPEAQVLLQALTQQLIEQQYFHATSDYRASAILANGSENKTLLPVINRQKSRLHFELNQYDQANALLDTQTRETNNPIDHINARLLQVKIAMWQEQWSKARTLSQDLLVRTSKLGLKQVSAAAFIESAWVALAFQQFEQGMQYLNKAVINARLTQEPLLEYQSHLIQAFIADKMGEKTLARVKLDMASAVMNLHKLDSSHSVHKLRVSAWMATDQKEKLKYNEQILAQTYRRQYRSDFYNAANSVRNYYVEHRDWAKALATIQPWQSESFKLLSQAKISFGERKDDAPDLAYQAFLRALIEHNSIQALDAALFSLLQSLNRTNTSRASELKGYIEQHATPRWLNQNRAGVTKLSKTVSLRISDNTT